MMFNRRRYHKRFFQIHQPEANGSNHKRFRLLKGKRRTHFGPPCWVRFFQNRLEQFVLCFQKLAAWAPCGEPLKPEEPLSRDYLFLNCRAVAVNRKSYAERLGIRRFCASREQVSGRDQTIETTMTGQIGKFSQAAQPMS